MKSQTVRCGRVLWIFSAALCMVLLSQTYLEPTWLSLTRQPVEVQAATVTPAAKGKELLDELIRKANEEGELVTTIQSSWPKTLIPPLADTFKKRFGLHTKLTIANMRPAQHYPVAIAETQAGAPPTYDVVQGDDAETMQLIGAGGIQKIENWEVLLAEVNPPVRSGKVRANQISRGPFAGSAFLILSNLKLIIYNTRLISEKELPKTHAELMDPKYKGKFAQPPWTSHWEIAPAALGDLDKQGWLEVVRKAGRNAAAVLHEVLAAQRVVLGEFAFSLAATNHPSQILAKDPKVPIGFMFFEDYNEITGVYYAMRTRTRRPAAATLFALWMTTPEAQAIYQPMDMQAVPYGESKIDQDFKHNIEKLGAKAIGFLDNERTVELLKWYRTEEGTKYLDAMARAIRGE